jgi:hypothetical protein
MSPLTESVKGTSAVPTANSVTKGIETQIETIIAHELR